MLFSIIVDEVRAFLASLLLWIGILLLASHRLNSFTSSSTRSSKHKASSLVAYWKKEFSSHPKIISLSKPFLIFWLLSPVARSSRFEFFVWLGCCAWLHTLAREKTHTGILKLLKKRILFLSLQAPLTMPECLDFTLRPYDRERGLSFPGLNPTFKGKLGTAGPWVTLIPNQSIAYGRNSESINRTSSLL